MLAFLVRRLIGALLVLIAVSFITYLIFVKIPGGDPALRIAGRTATDANIADIKEKLRLNDPFYDQYWGMMKSLFTARTSRTSRRSCGSTTPSTTSTGE